jgi:hypothetical protein
MAALSIYYITQRLFKYCVIIAIEINVNILSSFSRCYQARESAPPPSQTGTIGKLPSTFPSEGTDNIGVDTESPVSIIPVSKVLSYCQWLWHNALSRPSQVSLLLTIPLLSKHSTHVAGTSPCPGHNLHWETWPKGGQAWNNLVLGLSHPWSRHLKYLCWKLLISTWFASYYYYDNTLVSQIIISMGKCISLLLSAEGLGSSTKTLPGNDRT